MHSKAFLRSLYEVGRSRHGPGLAATLLILAFSLDHTVQSSPAGLTPFCRFADRSTKSSFPPDFAVDHVSRTGHESSVPWRSTRGVGRNCGGYPV
jgi:hypothetical protein